jgi:hypothetical protein
MRRLPIDEARLAPICGPTGRTGSSRHGLRWATCRGRGRGRAPSARAFRGAVSGELRGLPAVGGGPGAIAGSNPAAGPDRQRESPPVVDALRVRAAAAIDLVEQGLLDSNVTLAHVVWPTDKVLVASEVCADQGGPKARTEEQRLRALAWSTPACRGRLRVVRLACRRRRCRRGSRSANKSITP